MPISVCVRSERSQDISGFVQYQRIVREDAVDEFPLLNQIDPYGLTIFNRFQVVLLMRELTRAAELTDVTPREILGEVLGLDAVPKYARVLKGDPKEAVLALVDDLLKLCEFAQGGVHRYLWFIGD
jgi:hypothetical protein